MSGIRTFFLCLHIPKPGLSFIYAKKYTNHTSDRNGHRVWRSICGRQVQGSRPRWHITFCFFNWKIQNLFCHLCTIKKPLNNSSDRSGHREWRSVYGRQVQGSRSKLRILSCSFIIILIKWSNVKRCHHAHTLNFRFSRGVKFWKNHFFFQTLPNK